MKKVNTILMVAALAMIPLLSNAQWSAVRFDSSNTFLKVEAATANDVFVIGSEPTAYENFFMRSDDGGTTWDSIGLSTASDDFQMSEISFPDVNNGYIGGRRNNIYQNLQKTTDNGTTWTNVTPDPTQVEPISGLFFLNTSQGWATCGRNLYITSNAGTNWLTVPLNFIPVDIHFTDALTGYMSGGDTTSWYAVVMKTTDGGLTWNVSLTNHDGNVFVNSDNNLNFVDQNTFFTSQEWSNRIYRTADAGTTWDTIICDSAQQIVDFHFESADSGHVLTSMGQLFYTNDAGATWSLAYSAEWGLYGPSVYFYSLSFSQGVGYVCGSSGLIKRFDYNPMGIGNQPVISASLVVYPNPCYGYPAISILNSGMTGDCVMRIINAQGQIVKEQKVAARENNPVITYYTQDLAPGTYSVVLSNDKQVRTTKLIIAE